jgi:hypothetical protein
VDRRRRVVVGVSESVGSLQALRHAAAEARTRDALLVAVHAWLRRAAISPSTATQCPSCGRYGERPLQGAFDAALCGPPGRRR